MRQTCGVQIWSGGHFEKVNILSWGGVMKGVFIVTHELLLILSLSLYICLCSGIHHHYINELMQAMSWSRDSAVNGNYSECNYTWYIVCHMINSQPKLSVTPPAGSWGYEHWFLDMTILVLMELFIRSSLGIRHSYHVVIDTHLWMICISAYIKWIII